MLSKCGITSFIYKYFRYKEVQLYNVSDFIGCMSQANVDYIIENNDYIPKKQVEICPNSIEVIDKSVSESIRLKIRKKYDIPLDKKVFVYGGNLGKPQGIPFLIECLRNQKSNNDLYFLIVGDGTEYGNLELYCRTESPQNVKLMKRLPKEDYDLLVGACDVGMIFLDYRFTIPNFPSRLLSYLQAKLPVLACTDRNTDIGDIIEEYECGWWSYSNDIQMFEKILNDIMESDCKEKGKNSFNLLMRRYSVKDSCDIILDKLKF